MTEPTDTAKLLSIIVMGAVALIYLVMVRK